ncbi:MAG: preprotein translocase subunit SecA [Deltaproteobacteria bacterium]|nr:preprotein translocase subunit SecA [Deltaproteobacteria bacterium]
MEWLQKWIAGSKNEREIRGLQPLVEQVKRLEPEMQKLRSEDFARKILEWKDQVQKQGRTLDELMPEVFALTRESAVRILGMRHFDVQILGGAVLHRGRIAEMKTGEGKTLVATLPCVLNALEGRGVHVVTVNDYLARRDAEWMGKVYGHLGLTVGVILHGLTDQERQEAYGSDITYGQNNEFGFDYLRDNMKFRLQDYVQRELNYAIVDEVDSILIDEARTPLIISGPAADSSDLYARVNNFIPRLVRDADYTLDEKSRTASLTDEGIEKLEKLLAVPNLYDPGEIETLHHVEQALRAHTLYKNEVDYVIREGEVLIVDEHTGRLMPGRRWSDGLHQAIEAKEGVKIQKENQTLATISFQNYFRMYTKLSGMTGTAETEREEFQKIYGLEVVVVPTNRPLVRKDREDVIYKTEREKFNAAMDEIQERRQKGQPVLVGTASIAKSEVFSNLMKKRGIQHNVLNAKQHEREAYIVAQAGKKGSVTISTNMAGRGTDIILGGNAEMMAKYEVPDYDETEEARQRFEQLVAKYEVECKKEKEEVLAAGGLHILATERHESRRIDNQLRGRGGRQGDPGESRFYLSLEDDLMRIFGGERVMGLMDRLGMEEGEPIEHRWLTKSIEGAQRRVEGHNFDIRKNLLEYDDVMNQQRRTIYGLRRRVLAAGAGVPLIEFDEEPKTRKKIRKEVNIGWEEHRESILDLFEDLIMAIMDDFCPERGRPDEWDLVALANAVREQFNVQISFDGAERNRETLQEQIWKVVEKGYEDKEKILTSGGAASLESVRKLEQYIWLQTIDQQWKDHLLTMDHLRQGIVLQGYGQRDPKKEYAKEGYALFSAMIWRIRSSTVSTLMRIQPTPTEDTAAIERKYAARQQKQKTVESHGGEAEAEKPRQRVRTGPKVGRNDPCPCGSGKKYKKCCMLKDAA